MKQNLWAVFDKDGNLAETENRWDGKAFASKSAAWFQFGCTGEAAIKRAKRQGYTCCEVEIVRVQK